MYNKITLIGRLGQDVEVSHGQHGEYFTFSLATSKSWKNAQGEWVDKTEWHSCIYSGKYASSMANGLFKGRLLLVEGELTYTKKDNVTYSNVRAYTIRKLDKEPEMQGTINERHSPFPEPKKAADPFPSAKGGDWDGTDEDDLPF